MGDLPGQFVDELPDVGPDHDKLNPQSSKFINVPCRSCFESRDIAEQNVESMDKQCISDPPVRFPFVDWQARPHGVGRVDPA